MGNDPYEVYISKMSESNKQLFEAIETMPADEFYNTMNGVVKNNGSTADVLGIIETLGGSQETADIIAKFGESKGWKNSNKFQKAKDLYKAGVTRNEYDEIKQELNQFSTKKEKKDYLQQMYFDGVMTDLDKLRAIANSL